MFAILVVLAVLAGLAAVSIAPGLLFRAAGIARLRRLSRKKLLLTYDDGPSSPSPTPQILDLLDARKARATFFLVGLRVDESPALCRRLAAAGHDLGSHGYSHRHGWLDPLRAITDLGAGVRAVAPYRRARAIYRQPYGKSTLWTLLAGLRLGAVAVWWTLDSCDSRDTLPDIESVLQRVEREEGGVVLMHDYPREATSPGGRFTLELTARLLDLAARRGWHVCTASELFARTTAQPAARSA
jgi:peptidoglycan/xylan/chitin deacetylase (PgdA/CDA1 family)